MNEFYSLINNSKLTILGYTTKDEKIKDELISSLNPIFIGDENINSSSILIDIREKKINSLLNDEFLSNIITFDIINIKSEDNVAPHFSITKTVREIHDKLRDTNMNIIVTAPLYTLYTPIDHENGIKQVIRGGEGNTYIANLVIYIDDRTLNIIKSRETNKKQIYV